MCVGDICRREVVTITPDAGLCDAARVMREKHVGILVVVGAATEQGDRLVQGVLTDRDIVVTVVGRDAEPKDLNDGHLRPSGLMECSGSPFHVRVGFCDVPCPPALDAVVAGGFRGRSALRILYLPDCAGQRLRVPHLRVAAPSHLPPPLRGAGAAAVEAHAYRNSPRDSLAAQFLVSSEVFTSTVLFGLIAVGLYLLANRRSLAGRWPYAKTFGTWTIIAGAILLVVPVAFTLFGPQAANGAPNSSVKSFQGDLLGSIVPTHFQRFTTPGLESFARQHLAASAYLYLGLPFVLAVAGTVVWLRARLRVAAGRYDGDLFPPVLRLDPLHRRTRHPCAVAVHRSGAPAFASGPGPAPLRPLHLPLRRGRSGFRT